ncbi:MRX complex DNA-binding subunit [Sugiyamaella lignohabitans]|uniref:DNA repair protein RAD50 n=1 Tax=Sugiyamaella lignohabitans TaxID=796027 RepID=A0A167C6E1_9ASCO|nr:MRX complex DNA-binding subunit [Sugiyamaella lignohabitans]ANB11275.1 MRX complex DNA-binding subunit [Sugiyamaella lignohabitans]
MDKQVPLYLGASKAVLDYVIFCHQEDSLWPLAEATVVKKRFDEIFQVSKYTKAIESLKSLRKENISDISLAQKDVQYLEAAKERAEKAERRADMLTIQIDTYSTEADALKTRMEVVSAETNEFLERNQKFQENIYKLRTAREQRDHTNENIQRLSQGLEEMTEDEADLEKILNDFETRVNEKKNEKETLSQKIHASQAKLSNTRRKFNEMNLKEGQLRAELEAHNVRLAERKQFIADKSKVLNLMDIHREAVKDEALDDSLGEDSYIGKFEKSLERQLNRVQSEQEAMRLKGSEAENEISIRIQDLTTQKLRLEQKKLSNTESIRSFEKEIETLQTTINNIKIDEGTLEFEKSSVEGLVKGLELAQSRFNELEEKDELSKKKAELTEIEEEIEICNADIVASNQYADDRAKFKLLKDDLAKRRAGLTTSMEKHNTEFERVVGSAINAETVENDLKSAINRISANIDSQTESLEEAQKAVLQTQASIDHVTKEIADRETEAKELREEVQEIFRNLEFDEDTNPIVDYEAIISELDKDLTDAIHSVEGSSFMASYFKQAKHQAESQNVCFLCERRFETTQDRIRFIESVVERGDKIPAQETELKEQFQAAQENLDRAHNAGTSVKRVRSIELSEIPSKREELSKLREKLDIEQSEMQRRVEQTDLIKSDLKEVEGLRAVAGDIARHFEAINTLESQIESMERRFPSQGERGAKTRAAKEIHELLSDLNNRAKVVKSDIARLQTARETSLADINQMKNNVSAKRLELSKMESQLSEKINQEKRIVETKAKIGVAREAIKEANEQLDEMLPQLREKEHELSKAKLESAAAEKELSNKYNLVYQISNELGRMSKAIIEYTAKGGREKLEECQASVKQFSGDVETVEKDISELNGLLNEKERELLDMKGFERKVQDNLEVRRLNQKLLELEVLITELESHDAERNKEKYEKEMTRLRNEYSQLNSKYSSIIGEIKQLDDQLKIINDELATEFLDVKENYRKAIIKLETRKVANEDLAKYSKAMDSAIMQYHSEKMKEINAIIDELWKKTYTGTDVDTIMIRSDHESSRGNRTYNYRVSMIKDDAELDMRGRCSAGQKVLACIIVRLALAECFGKKCGIITLDEPTTNLDERNCEALARSLGQIIESRRNQSNFQLIVITHDQNFIAHMNASAYVDKYFQVSRNATQGSKIDCLPISQILVR